jgi:hypothetical protein
VVFQDSAIVDTVNLETMTIACFLFAAYAVLVGIAATTISAFSPQRRKWFWPDPAKRPSYGLAAALNVLAIIVVVVVVVIMPPASRDRLLIGVIILALAAGAGTWLIVVRSVTLGSLANTSGNWQSFFLARSAFLVVVAALPALACFQMAYGLETMLLAIRETVQREQDAMTWPGDRFQPTPPDFVATNTYVPLWPSPDHKPDHSVTLSTLDSRLLKQLHLPYNEVATDLSAYAATAFDGQRAAQVPTPALRFLPLLVIVPGLFVISYAFVWWFVKPVFVLDVVAATTRTRRGSQFRSGHVLVFGPPGSEKSKKLAQVPGIRIFDIPTLASTERRKKAVAVPDEQRVSEAAAAAAAGASGSRHGAGSAGEASDRGEPFAPVAAAPGEWADNFDYATLPAVLGINHIDYRLDEPQFAAQTVTFIERAVSRGGGTVLIVSDRDPIAVLRDRGAATCELDRWTRVLGSCRQEIASIGRTVDEPVTNAVEKAVFGEARGIPQLERIATDVLTIVDEPAGVKKALALFRSAAAPYYQSLWESCTVDERLALRHLAEDGTVNPQNQAVAQDLVGKGLVVRDPVVRIMNTTFSSFVLHAASATTVGAWEQRGVRIPWVSIEIGMWTVVVILAGGLILTQEQLINAWVGFIPVALPPAQQLIKLVAGWRPAASNTAVNV